MVVDYRITLQWVSKTGQGPALEPDLGGEAPFTEEGRFNKLFLR